MTAPQQDYSAENLLTETQPYGFGVPYLEAGKVYVEFMVWHSRKRKPTKYRLEVARMIQEG